MRKPALRRVMALAGLLALGMAQADEMALARARKIVSGSCFLCHGAQGESATELFPRLAAQNANYLAKQLANYRSGERKSAAMEPMAKDLSDSDLRALGLYFSLQKSEPHPPGDPKAALWGRGIYERGGAATEVAACIGCHGERGHGADTLPRLAGQVASYLVTQLKNFGARARTNDNAVMHTIAAKMTPPEMEAVAEYLSSLE